MTHSVNNTPNTPDKPRRRHRGPWTHRFLIGVFSAAFGILLYWLLGFVLRDIATLPGPSYAKLEESGLSADLREEGNQVRQRIADINRTMAEDRQRQSVLRDSTANSERTMTQLLELQKLTLQKGVKPTDAEQSALGESEQLFLTAQRKYQEINDKIAKQTEELSQMEARRRTVEAQLEEERKPIREEYQRLGNRHQWKLAALQLALLLPMLVIGVWLFLRKRGGLYSPLMYGFGIAVVVQVGMVMHQHFPRRYFKYVLIGAAIVLVARVLVYLLRMMAFPKQDWLLKQHREAYERFFCPVCNYPIRRGPLKHLFWTRRSLKKMSLSMDTSAAPEESYVCPACGTTLFEECGKCHGIRHSLLPVCAKCGEEKPIVPSAASS